MITRSPAFRPVESGRQIRRGSPELFAPDARAVRAALDAIGGPVVAAAAIARLRPGTSNGCRRRTPRSCRTRRS
jgi:hypothetical protein